VGVDRTTGGTEASDTAAGGTAARGDGPRRFVYGYLALLLVGAIGSVELWPLTGWRLYVEPRKSTHPSWELEAVDTSGTEHAVTLYELPIAYRNTDRQLGDAASVVAERADALCREWLEAFRTHDPAFTTLRIYRTRIATRSGDKLTRALVHECRAGPA
jgi:hypothetical protein